MVQALVPAVSETVYCPADTSINSSHMQVVPLYCFDPRNFIATPWNNPKTGAFRAQFLIESVADLKRSLQQIGSDLMVHMGTPEEAVRGKPPCMRQSQEAMRVILRLCDQLDSEDGRLVVPA